MAKKYDYSQYSQPPLTGGKERGGDTGKKRVLDYITVTALN